MNPEMGARRTFMAKLLAGLVVAGGLVAASIGTAYARHGADDGPHHRHGADDRTSIITRTADARHSAEDDNSISKTRERHGAEDGPRHRQSQTRDP